MPFNICRRGLVVLRPLGAKANKKERHESKTCIWSSGGGGLSRLSLKVRRNIPLLFIIHVSRVGKAAAAREPPQKKLLFREIGLFIWIN